jgi:hypothetical protein
MTRAFTSPAAEGGWLQLPRLVATSLTMPMRAGVL